MVTENRSPFDASPARPIATRQTSDVGFGAFFDLCVRLQPEEEIPLIRISIDDALRGLKRFKRLAKQDLLASPLTNNPRFWRIQAEARRSQYTELMNIVEKDGVEMAYCHAVGRYASLPRVISSDPDGLEPVFAGQKLALEMFFTMLGVTRQAALQAAAATKPRAPRSESRVAGGAFV
jgi:hypothetical protein